MISEMSLNNTEYTDSELLESLREELRIRDEEIANLKARLERIEALLDISDDNK